MKLRGLVLMLGIAASTAQAQTTYPFTFTFFNGTTYPWSSGLITLSPLIGVGLTPQPPSNQYYTYAFANSHCDIAAGCPGGGCDNGNATVLAQRWGLTLGVNAWLVPAIAANSSSPPVTIQAPVGSRLSYIAWVANTGVFDDFVALRDPTNVNVLSVPLFDATGQPRQSIPFSISAYDVNSSVQGNGNSATCTPECPTATTGCWVAVGNASSGSGGGTGTPPTPPIANPTATSGNQRNTLFWTNVSPHDGVIIVRRPGQAVGNWTPTNGTIYPVGQSVQGGTGAGATRIAYVEYGTTPLNTFTDTGQGLGTLANGTTYYYKIYAHANTRTYSTGNVPSSAGFFSRPTSGSGANNPAWCYSFNLATAQRPTSESNTSVFTASNSGTIVGVRTSDGIERFRPTVVNGAVQARFPLLDLSGITGKRIVAGDQTGRVYAINSSNGTITWIGNNGTPLPNATIIQHFPVPWSASGLSPWTRILVATRQGTANRVYALNATSGQVIWTYAMGAAQMVSGGMVVQGTKLYVPTLGNPSLVVLDAATGAFITSRNPGPIGFDLGKDANGLIYAVTTNGNASAVYWFNPTTDNQVGTQSLGNNTTPTGPLFVTGNGYVVSRSNGTVARYTVASTPAPAAPTAVQLWSTAIGSIPTPTGVVLPLPPIAANYFVGSSNGNVYQLNTQTGAIQKTVAVSTGSGVGMPTVDSAAARMHIGTLNGRLCSYPLPLP